MTQVGSVGDPLQPSDATDSIVHSPLAMGHLAADDG